MKTGTYICNRDWRGHSTLHVRVEAKETDKSFILKLIEDSSRFPDGHMKVLFGTTGKATIRKSGSPHAILNGEDWFTVYPDRNGVPFLFELETGARE